MDLLEGIPLNPKRAAHFERCGQCRTALREVAPYFGDMADPEPRFPGAMAPDWDRLRDSVRDRLLARAVKRSSLVGRWTGQILTPAAAWGLGLALVVSMGTLLGIWHYRTSHEPFPTSASAVETGTEVPGAGFGVFLEDPAALETEALAWSDADLFIALNELEESEEETLLELMALAFDQDDGV
jgi:hypothetical protein